MRVSDIHTEVMDARTMIGEVRTIVENIQREVVRDPGHTSATERQVLLVGGPEQATSSLRVEDNQLPPTSGNPVDGGEDTYPEDVDEIEYLDDDQTSDSTETVRSLPEQSSESPSSLRVEGIQRPSTPVSGGENTGIEEVDGTEYFENGQTSESADAVCSLLEQASESPSLLRVENSQRQSIPENTDTEEGYGIGYLEEDQTSEGTETARSLPDQSSESPLVNAQQWYPNEPVIGESVAEFTHATTSGPGATEEPEQSPHTEFGGLEAVDSGLTAVITSLPTLLIVDEPFRNEDVAPARLPPSPSPRDNASSDPTLPQHAEEGSYPQTVQGMVIASLQSTMSQEGVCNTRRSEHTPLYPGELPQLSGNLDQNTDYSTQRPASCCRVDIHGTPLPPTVDPTPGVSILVDDSMPAYKRLISSDFSPQELISLIGAIFTSKDEVKMICNLRGDEAQTFIDIIHEVHSAAFHFRDAAC